MWRICLYVKGHGHSAPGPGPRGTGIALYAYAPCGLVVDTVGVGGKLPRSSSVSSFSIAKPTKEARTGPPAQTRRLCGGEPERVTWTAEGTCRANST